MLKTIIILCAAAIAFGADDPWAKVKELKTGTELQVYKRGSIQPLAVKMDELTDQNLIVINKNAQTAILRDNIDRIDARPSGKTRTVNETKVNEKNAATALASARRVLSKARIRFRERCLVGEPGDCIARVAKEEGSDLIAMGSHGRGALKSLLLGSVVTKTLALTRVPVLVVR